MKPQIYIDQKITAFVNRYVIYSADENGDKVESIIAFAEQKRLAFKEKVTFFTDEDKATVAFTFRAEKVMDVHGRYFVEDDEGNVLGMFRKEFKKSIFVSSWVLMDRDGADIVRVKESNVALAVLRRFVGWLPFVGDILNIIMNFFKYHFIFTRLDDSEVVGKYEKITLFRDHYSLSVDDALKADLDWRVLAAMGVALDALQSR